ncbi:MAG: hypothetical protein ACK5MZ_07155 [Aestuariibaculum sp.]
MSLAIKGSTTKETFIIDSIGYTTKHNNYKSVKDEVDLLLNTLSKIGYIETQLKSINKPNDSTFTASFYLNKKYTYIYIRYNTDAIDNDIIRLASKDFDSGLLKIKLSDTEATLNFINLKLSENGQPFSQVKLTNIEIDVNGNLSADLIHISSEEKRFIDNIVIKGYENFPKSYLNHFLNIKREQTFNLNTLKEKTENLNLLRFSRELKSPEVLFTKDSTTVYLYLEKTKSNTFDGFLGFGSNENTNKLEFTGYVNLNLTNNLNYGESLKLLYKGDQNEQKTFEVNVSLPYLLKSPIGANFNLRIFKRDSSFTTVNQSAKLHYQINAKHKIYTGITAIESNNLLKNNSLLIDDYKSSFYTASYAYQNTQPKNMLFPIKSYFNFESGFGKRKQNRQKTNQNLFTANGFKIFNLNTNNSIFVNAGGALLNSDDYLENELFRFGGINSIRGFEENSIYASLFGILNTEYRYRLNPTIYIHSITDIAYYQNKLTGQEENLYGFGFGFGVLTKAGLLKLSYANGKSKSTTFKLANSKIHISLTAYF